MKGKDFKLRRIKFADEFICENGKFCEDFKKERISAIMAFCDLTADFAV